MSMINASREWTTQCDRCGQGGLSTGDRRRVCPTDYIEGRTRTRPHRESELRDRRPLDAPQRHCCHDEPRLQQAGAASRWIRPNMLCPDVMMEWRAGGARTRVRSVTSSLRREKTLREDNEPWTDNGFSGRSIPADRHAKKLLMEPPRWFQTDHATINLNPTTVLSTVRSERQPGSLVKTATTSYGDERRLQLHDCSSTRTRTR